MKRECETCIKRKTKWCPNSGECYDASEMIHYQNRIMLLEERDKYKSLYENEKDHTDTLKRIIKNIEEYIEKLYDNTDDIICYDIDKNCKKEILDLLKEIK